MTQQASTAQVMPDIARQVHIEPQGALEWVGMSKIHQPVVIHQNGQDHRVQASVDLYVDLTDPHAKGIHMSRLYLLLDEHSRNRNLSPASIKMILNSMHQSHRDISDGAYIGFAFDYCVRRAALKSDNAGWNNYPVTIKGVLENGETKLELGMDVTYSSTCPCSAALARQLIQASFDDAFKDVGEVTFENVRAWLGTEQGIVA
ncbi:MAG: GTP cyclohydrolase, FolE2/MptA family, partial [Gammaproteobacteria bacterium]